MSGRKKKNNRNVKEVDLNGSLISAISAGNSESLINLVRSHGFSHCQSSYGGYALLRDAIKLGQYDISKFLLEGTKVDSVTNGVNGLVHCATERGWAEFVLFLLERNAPIDALNDQKETPLHLAVKRGYANIVKVLLNKNASITAQTVDGLTPLYLAVTGKRSEIAQMLLKHACTNEKDVKDNVQSASPAENKNSTLLDRILLCSPSVRDKVNTFVVNTVTDDKAHSEVVSDLIDHGFVLGGEYVCKSLLVAAVRKNYIKLIENILSSNVNLKVAEYNPLLLQTAVSYGRKEIITLLLNSGFDVNAADANGRTSLCFLLHYAEESKCVAVMKLLFAHGADVQKTPMLLHRAVEKGLYEVCKVLIENGALIDTIDGNGNTPLLLALLKKDSDIAPRKKPKRVKKIDETSRNKIVQLLLSNGADVSARAVDGLTAFHRAVENGRIDAVRLLLDFGIGVNLCAEDDVTPLHLAALAGHEDILELLLAHKANMDARLENGATPLHLAAKNGHNKIVVTLCEKGADVGAHQENGWTPLHLAAHGQRAFATKTLLDHGADVDAGGSSKETALHCAFSGDPDENEVVEILLENGCDVNVKTAHGHVAMDIAIKECKSHFFGYECIDFESNGFDYVSSDNYSSSDEEQDFAPDLYPPIVDLQRHLVKLKVAGLYLCEKNLWLLNYIDKCSESNLDISEFEERCKEEINRIKQTKLNPKFPLFDILTNSKNLVYARNKLLVQAFKSFDFEKFCMYGSLIKKNFEKSMSRLDLMGSGQKSLDFLVRTSSKLNGTKSSVLPEELLELIVSFLDSHELKCLIHCGEALKHQISQ